MFSILIQRTELHDRTYDEVRKATDELNADLVCAARNRAADAVDSCAEKRKEGENPSKPRFTSDSVVYNLKRPMGDEVVVDTRCSVARSAIVAPRIVKPGPDSPGVGVADAVGEDCGVTTDSGVGVGVDVPSVDSAVPGAGVDVSVSA